MTDSPKTDEGEFDAILRNMLKQKPLTKEELSAKLKSERAVKKFLQD